MADIARRSCEAWFNKFNFPWHWMHTVTTSVVVHNTEMFQTNSDFNDAMTGHKYDLHIPKVTFIITGKEIYFTETNFFSRFSTPIQSGPEAHPSFCTMGTGSFPREKRPGRGVDQTPPSSTEVKERVELYLYSHSGPSWPVLGWTLPVPLPSALELKRNKP